MNLYVSKIRNTRITYGLNIFILIVLLIIHQIIRSKSTGADLQNLIIALIIAEIIVMTLLVAVAFMDSYLLVDNKLIMFHFFKISEIIISEIPTIIVTNNVNSGQSRYTVKIRNKARVNVSCPMISIISDDVKAIDCHYNRPIRNWDINELIKNEEAKFVYGFLFEKKLINNFQKNYRGKIYIARTVYENFKEEISDLYSKWEYENKNINILWDENSENDWCNSPYL